MVQFQVKRDQCLPLPLVRAVVRYPIFPLASSSPTGGWHSRKKPPPPISSLIGQWSKKRSSPIAVLIGIHWRVSTLTEDTRDQSMARVCLSPLKLPQGPNKQHVRHSICQLQLQSAGGIINEGLVNTESPFWGNAGGKRSFDFHFDCRWNEKGNGIWHHRLYMHSLWISSVTEIVLLKNHLGFILISRCAS